MFQIVKGESSHSLIDVRSGEGSNLITLIRVNTGVCSWPGVSVCLWSNHLAVVSWGGGARCQEKIRPERRDVGTQKAASVCWMDSQRGWWETSWHRKCVTMCVFVRSVFLQPPGDLLCGVGERRLDVRWGEETAYIFSSRFDIYIFTFDSWHFSWKSLNYNDDYVYSQQLHCWFNHNNRSYFT